MFGRDQIWSTGTRAKAIAATKEAREMCRRGKHGGYLEIANDSDSEEVRLSDEHSLKKNTLFYRLCPWMINNEKYCGDKGGRKGNVAKLY